MNDYRIQTVNGETVVSLEDGSYKGVVFTYGRVQLIPDYDKDVLLLKFEYNIKQGEVNDVDDFKDYVGPILVELIDKGLMNNDIVYTGGSE